MLREPLRPGGGNTQVHTLGVPKMFSLREVSATARGASGALWESCRDPQLQTLQVQRVSPRSLQEKWLSQLYILQCLGNVVPEASCLSLHFPNLSLILHCDHRSPNFLIAQPQVCFGGNSVSDCPTLSGHCVSFFVCHSSLSCTTKIVELLGSSSNGVDSLQQTPIIQHIYLH